MDTVPPHPPDVLLETSDPDQSLDFDFDETDLIGNRSTGISASSESDTSTEFDCEICGQVFRSNELLHNHLLSHDLNRNAPFLSNHVINKDPNTFGLLDTPSNEENNANVTSLSSNVDPSLINNDSRQLMNEQTDSNQGSDVYTCGVCAKHFSNIRLFEQHMLSHNEERSYFCPHCPKSYKYKWDLNRHFERKHMSSNSSVADNSSTEFDASQFINNYQCNVCSKSFLDKSQFELHCQESTCVRLLNCVSDGDQSSDDDENGHPSAFKCEQCPQSFDSRLLFKQHKLLHIRLYPCNKCDEKFVKFEHLHNHSCNESTPAGGANFASRISPLTVSMNGNKSQPIEPTQHQYTCGICQSVFTHKAIYERHCAQDCRTDLKNSNKFSGGMNNEINRPTQIPSNRLLDSSALPPPEVTTQPLGIPSNTQPQPDPCEICGKRFATLSNLKRHMMSHSKIRNFKCQYCHKSYIYKWDLTNHIKKAHKGMAVDDVKPLYSTKDFYSSSSDVPPEKQRRRNSNRPATTTASSSNALGSNLNGTSQGGLTCKHCGGVFLGQNSLHAHMILRHSGVINETNEITNELMHFVEHYTCTFCGKSFADKRLYRNHLGTHSGYNVGANPDAVGSGSSSLENPSNSSPEIYCNGCKAELMTEGIDLPSDEDVEYLCDVCDNERRRQEEAAGLAL